MSYHVPFEINDYTYGEAVAALQATKKFGIQPLLESVVDMLSELGNPDACFKSVQIAGTNGKTSTSRYTAAFLHEEGLKTALYTSPELVNFTERMEVEGVPVTEAVFGHGISAAVTAGRRVNNARAAAGKRPYDITEFDLLTVAALTVFAEADIDVAVLECGMGGRWDATSAAQNIVSVAVTGIGLDHTRILGDTLEKIAGEKAAIIKRGRTCVLGVGTATPASVEEVFLSRAAEEGVAPTLLRAADARDVAGEMQEGIVQRHANLPLATFAVTKRPARLGFPLELTLTTPRAVYADLAALKPGYQAANIALALCVAEDFLGRPLNADKAYTAAISCPTPGRFQLLRPDPLVLIDAAHNPQSVATFLSAIRAFEPDVHRRPKLLTAVLADKDVRGIANLLAKEFPAVIVTQTASKRALPAEELAEIYRELGAQVESVFPTVGAAVRALKHESYVACGTITLAGEVTALVGDFA
ncbi:Mur ligase family protein [Lancefieldella sp. Marseille-Q7238]|uniref:bifunctional folylpolyglutamate synthase/dihydrofolate synthase n=1 Tax=Lancefieldella sp. Marseille-Q7238 TaxID=3022127 RepID=UPI0024A8905A|nr:Mur ligase family protein [Lancefieldella sp. Marseille-Q7238]